MSQKPERGVLLWQIVFIGGVVLASTLAIGRLEPLMYFQPVVARQIAILSVVQIAARLVRSQRPLVRLLPTIHIHMAVIHRLFIFNNNSQYWKWQKNR